MKWTARLQMIPLPKKVTVWVPLEDGTLEGPVKLIAAREFVMEASGEGGVEEAEGIATHAWRQNRYNTPQYLVFPSRKSPGGRWRT